MVTETMRVEPDMDEPEEKPAALPPDLRFLRVLVTVLTAAMILGVITIVFLLVIRLNAETAPILVHPEMFEIPEGVGTIGFSVVNGQTIIIGDDAVIRVFDSETRTLLQEISTTQ